MSTDIAFAPLTAVQDTLTSYASINQIVVQAQSTQQLSAAQIEVTQICPLPTARLKRDYSRRAWSPVIRRFGRRCSHASENLVSVAKAAADQI